MISMVTLDGKKEELQGLKEVISDTAAHMTEEYWDTKYFMTYDENHAYLESEPLINFGCFDLSVKGVLPALPELRRAYEEMGMMLIAEQDMSPMDYLKPGIRADALMVRPLTRELMKETMDSFVSLGLERMQRERGEESFLVETREEKTYIPYDNIYYFEAREKKIFVRLLKEEYGFYSTIEELGGKLPKQFVRCHRSYIVNVDKIKKILNAQNMLELQQDFTIPLSRSYKHQVRNRKE